MALMYTHHARVLAADQDAAQSVDEPAGDGPDAALVAGLAPARRPSYRAGAESNGSQHDDQFAECAAGRRAHAALRLRPVEVVGRLAHLAHGARVAGRAVALPQVASGGAAEARRVTIHSHRALEDRCRAVGLSPGSARERQLRQRHCWCVAAVGERRAEPADVAGPLRVVESLGAVRGVRGLGQAGQQ